MGIVAALGSLVVATVLARYLTSRGAVVVGTTALVAGLAWYLFAVPTVAVAAVSIERIANSFLALLTGLSVLRILRANIWVIAIMPAPVFTTWLLVLRRRYALGAFVGAGALGFVVLTGDAGSTIALLGTTGALGVLGFGGADRAGITREQLANVGLLLALGVVAARLLRIVPDTDRSAPRGASVSGETGPQTLEGSLMSAEGEVSIAGSISLSPAVRFTVTADEPSYWHVAAYDR